MNLFCNNQKIKPGTVNLTSNIDALGDELSFDLAYNNTKFFPNGIEVHLGDIVRLVDQNGQECFRGIITEKTKTQGNFSYMAYDYAFYLNKSSIIMQLDKCSAKSAIHKVLTKCNIPVGKMELSGGCIIDEIYVDVAPSDILQEILEKSSIVEGKNYIMEMNEGNFCILDRENLRINCEIKLAKNVAPFSLSRVLGNISLKENINDMKNSIQTYKEDGKNIKEIYLANDEELISKFGLLQGTYRLETSKQAKAMANQILKESSKIGRELTVDVLGDFKLRAGRIVNLSEKEFALSGEYLLKSVTHNISSSVHTCSLTLDEVV